MKMQRSIYYLGNKARSASEIAQYCREFSRGGDYIVDLFAGSGAVARELSRFSSVITNDIQTYSRVICEAILRSTADDANVVRSLLTSATLQKMIASRVERYREFISAEREIARRTADNHFDTESERAALIAQLFSEADGNDPIIRTYGGLYFTVRDSCILQAFFDAVSTLTHNQRAVGEACLFSTASRCSVTVGNQFAQPQKLSYSDGRAKVNAGRRYINTLGRYPLEHALSALDIYPEQKRNSNDNKCLQGRDIDIAKLVIEKAKIVYLDPPYGREHYSRFYHVLEDMAVRKFVCDSELDTRMRPARFQSDYSLRSKAHRAFTDILDVCGNSGVPVAISYTDESRGSAVENRIVAIDFLRSLVRERYKRSMEFPISGTNYSQLNRLDGPETRKGLEVLIVGCN